MKPWCPLVPGAPSTRSSEWVARFSRDFKLSVRQETVLWLLVDGISVKRIAGELSISEITVRRHIEELCKKCGTRNQREVLALLARTLMKEVFLLTSNRLQPTRTTADGAMRVPVPSL